MVKGGNYGWVLNEGFHCFNPLNPSYPPPFSCAGEAASGEPLLLPLAAYNHADGIAVVGGFVYRGSRFPELWGKYVFGDFSRAFNPGSGRLFWLDPAAVPTQISSSGRRRARPTWSFTTCSASAGMRTESCT